MPFLSTSLTDFKLRRRRRMGEREDLMKKPALATSKRVRIVRATNVMLTPTAQSLRGDGHLAPAKADVSRENLASSGDKKLEYGQPPLRNPKGSKKGQRHYRHKQAEVFP